MLDLKEIQNEYNKMVKEKTAEVNRIIQEDLPMESGFAFKVKTHPMPTIEQAEKAKKMIENIRDEVTKKRDEIRNLRNAEVEEKIKALGDLIGSKDYSKKKTTDAKWVVLAREQSRISESLSSTLFWRDSPVSLLLFQNGYLREPFMRILKR